MLVEDAVWTLRKCAAAALDILANTFQENLLPIFLPHIRQMLEHSNWLIRETAILAVGAVAEGCFEGMAPYLAELVPFLLGNICFPRVGPHASHLGKKFNSGLMVELNERLKVNHASLLLLRYFILHLYLSLCWIGSGSFH